MCLRLKSLADKPRRAHAPKARHAPRSKASETLATEGLELELSRLAFVEQTQHFLNSAVWKDPFTTNTFLGRFDQMSVGSWTAQILLMMSSPRQDRVAITLLKYVEVGFDRFKVLGIDEPAREIHTCHDDAQKALRSATRAREPRDVDWLRMPSARQAHAGAAGIDLEGELERLLQEVGELNDQERQNMQSLLRTLEDEEKDEEAAEVAAASESSACEEDGAWDGDGDDIAMAPSDQVKVAPDEALADDAPAMEMAQCEVRLLPYFSGEPPEATRARRRAVFFGGWRGDTIDVVCRELCVEVASSNTIFSCLDGDSRTALGTCKCTFNGTTVVATCKVHSDCKLVLSEKVPMGNTLMVVEADTAAWLASAREWTKSEHADLSKNVRRQIYGMRIRN